jgi:Skp family chaperone for outer membrane proteins
MAPGGFLRALAMAGYIAVAPVLAWGQAAEMAPPAAIIPLLILDQEELFLRSEFGQRIRADIARASAELSAENRQIEAELVAEEQALTEERATLPGAEFRVKARAFDEKVTAIRAEQDAKARAINRTTEEAQQAFFSRVAEVLLDIMRERGAVAILDQRVVLLSSEAVDITELAVTRIDQAIGDGTDR